MEVSFGLLLGAFALSFVAAGGAWAHLALGVDRPMYRSREAVSLGIPAVVAATLACACLVVPTFDVAYGTHLASAGVALAAVLVGLRVGRGATIARGLLWPLAAGFQAWALTQAVGIV